MAESSKIKPSNTGNEVSNCLITLLNSIPNDETIEKDNSSACSYSGDAELECLKKELVDSDVKEPNNLMSEPEDSSSESNQGSEMNDGIEDYEMASVGSEYSSGVGTNSDASSDFSNSSYAHSFTKNGESTEEIQDVEPLNHLDVANAAKAIFAESLELENLKDQDSAAFSGTVKSESFSSEDLNESTGVLDVKVNKQEIKVETEPSSVAGCSKPVETPFPIMPFKGKCKLRESNPAEFVVPFIGKKIDWGDVDLTPAPFDPVLAAAINRQNFERNGRYIPKMTFQEYITKRQARTKEEVEMDDKRDEFIAVRVSAYVLKNLAKILWQMQKDEPDEEAMLKYFDRFLRVPVSPLAMIHIPQFVHTVMYIRSCPDFSLKVRNTAQECFDKIHVLFPIPDGYNFETVYTNEIQKCLPEEFDGMYDFLLEYDDFEWESEDEDSDSAFSEEF